MTGPPWTVLYSYCELAGRLPESADPASRDHMDLLRGVAAEARLALERGDAPSAARGP